MAEPREHSIEPTSSRFIPDDFIPWAISAHEKQIKTLREYEGGDSLMTRERRVELMFELIRWNLNKAIKASMVRQKGESVTDNNDAEKIYSMENTSQEEHVDYNHYLTDNEIVLAYFVSQSLIEYANAKTRVLAPLDPTKLPLYKQRLEGVEDVVGAGCKLFDEMHVIDKLLETANFVEP